MTEKLNIDMICKDNEQELLAITAKYKPQKYQRTSAQLLDSNSVKIAPYTLPIKM